MLSNNYIILKHKILELSHAYLVYQIDIFFLGYLFFGLVKK